MLGGLPPWFSGTCGSSVIRELLQLPDSFPKSTASQQVHSSLETWCSEGKVCLQTSQTSVKKDTLVSDEISRHLALSKESMSDPYTILWFLMVLEQFSQTQT